MSHAAGNTARWNLRVIDAIKMKEKIQEKHTYLTPLFDIMIKKLRKNKEKEIILMYNK